jgi:mRNA interferase YafQ
MLKLEYSSQFKKDFKKIAKLPIPDIIECWSRNKTIAAW